MDGRIHCKFESLYGYIVFMEIDHEISQRTTKPTIRHIVTSKDSDKLVHPPSMARVLIYLSLDSPEAVKGTCDQRRLWSDCADAQADLSLRWSPKSYCRFCRALARIISMVILPLPLIQEGQFSVSGKEICIRTGLPHRGLSLPRKMCRLTDRLHMNSTVLTGQ